MQMRVKEGRDEERSRRGDRQPIDQNQCRSRPRERRGYGKKKFGDANDTLWSIPKAIFWTSKSPLRVIPTWLEKCQLLEPLKDHFPRLRLLWGDSHYGGKLRAWTKELLGWHIQVVHRLGTARDASTMESTSQMPSSKPGFQPLPRRWVVERSFAWMTRWRRLCRDHEGLPATSEAFIKLSASRRMLSRLTSVSS